MKITFESTDEEEFDRLTKMFPEHLVHKRDYDFLHSQRVDSKKEESSSIEPEKLKPITIKDCILQIVNKHNGLTAVQMTKYIDARIEQLQPVLYYLTSEKLILKSSGKPTVYYNREQGDTDLAESLKLIKRGHTKQQ